jgi:two-component system, sensor histidine kinase and response regulator
MSDARNTFALVQPVDDSTRVKCLLVDDREENLLALSRVLQADGVDVVCARSGPEALDLLLGHDFALAVLDVQMPEMDGFELAGLMRGSERTRRIPIIFVTAGAHDQSRIFRGYDTGAVDFLYKPIDPQILQNKADVFFQLHRQRQQLARELQRSTETLRLNEMFMAVLGHDLRNPLNVLSIGAQMLEKQAGDEEAVRRTAARMLGSAQRMGRLIDDLLDLARARQGGGIPLQRSRLNLEAVVRRVAQEHEPLFGNRPLEIRADGSLAGVWDHDRLAQLLGNLLSNALTHGRDAAVRIDVDGTDLETVRLSVTNAGTIPAEVLPYVFNPFSSGDTRRRSDGVGLGLYIVQQIVEAHGGRVGVVSADDATTFTVVLPRAPLAAALA